MPFANVRQWERAINERGRLTQAAIAGTVQAMANHAIAQVQARIPPGASDASGMANPFPGYAASGTLKGLVRAGPVTRQGNQYRSRVSVDPHPVHSTIPLVHEYGMTIRARRAPYLVFQVNGQWVRTKQVRIKPKRFFGAGWDASERTLPGVLEREMQARLG